MNNTIVFLACLMVLIAITGLTTLGRKTLIVAGYQMVRVLATIASLLIVATGVFHLFASLLRWTGVVQAPPEIYLQAVRKGVIAFGDSAIRCVAAVVAVMLLPAMVVSTTALRIGRIAVVDVTAEFEPSQAPPRRRGFIPRRTVASHPEEKAV